jgi:hypothetical protein
MAFAAPEDKAPDPVDVGLLGAVGELLEAHDLAALVKEAQLRVWSIGPEAGHSRQTSGRHARVLLGQRLELRPAGASVKIQGNEATRPKSPA